MGAIRDDGDKIDAVVASTIFKVVMNGLDGELGTQLEQDIPAISDCPYMSVMACNAEIYKQAAIEVRN